MHLNSIGCANNSALANGSVSRDQVREGLRLAANRTAAPLCADGTLFIVSQRSPPQISAAAVAADPHTPATDWLRTAEHTVEPPRSDLSVSSAVHKQKPRLNETAAICRNGPALFWSQADLVLEGQLA